jgi:DNA-directed RNA polymerase subunit N (RpoN/RPB10)
MNIIKLKCETCGKIFDKPKKEYNRRIKNGKNKFYCGYSCNSKRTENIEHIKKQKSSIDISVYSKNRCDKYSVFKYYLSIISRKDRGRKGNVDIDLKYLKFLWESQDGICPITGIKMPYLFKLQNKPRQYILVNIINNFR